MKKKLRNKIRKIYVLICALIFVLVGLSAIAVAGTWSTEGNELIGDEFIGTTNAAALVFKTNSESRMVITENGLVGIGIADPANLLSVAGSMSVGSTYAAEEAPNDGMLIEGEVGIGTPEPTEKLEVNGNIHSSGRISAYNIELEKQGTAKANLDIFQMTNTVNAADMDGTKTSILFNQYYYDASTPAIADAGRITVGTETDWTSTASTQDGYMAFYTVKDGTLNENVRIDSSGNLDVAGTIEMTGFKMPTGASNGYVLTSDGSGIGTWQAASGSIGGSGTTNYIPKFTAASTLGNSVIYETGGNIGIGTPSPGAYKLNVAGSVYVAGNIALTGTVDGYDISTSASTWASDSSTTNELPIAGDDIDVTGVPANTVALEDDIDVSYVRASTGNGLKLYDDGSTLGIWIRDGGDVGIGSTLIPANCQLYVLGGNNYNYAGYFENTWNNAGAIGILADCSPSAGVGTGAEIEGGSTGTYSFVNQNGASTYTGVDAKAWGTSPSTGGTWRGVYAYAYGSGTSTTNYGIYARASGASVNYAGYFNGNLHVAGTLSKSGGQFKIDHPLDPANKYLSHSFVESPDMMNVYNGNIVLDEKGEAWVELPEWFETINRDFRYQLTAIGSPGPNLYVTQEISDNQFKIAGGEPDLKVSWQVTGIRQDPWANKYRIQVEEVKPDSEKGKYLHPELYGLPENMAIGYFEPENT